MTKSAALQESWYKTLNIVRCNSIGSSSGNSGNSGINGSGKSGSSKPDYSWLRSMK